ncbi:uncharacterized protein LOC117318010 isoform X2 [Pecten maximus]|uniref:uncharacterized protein LOC117318010 isoform X2 n=1 Tax=Pecten maximus TaxID=6579 RepID=UPI001458A41F|nr:uncharacterized protein LOC117318010 isoform X2 [Pecten maximus]
MAEKGDPKGWVEGLEDDEVNEGSKKSFRDASRRVLQQQKALQVYDDHGPIVMMPQESKKWSTLIDDTIASVKRMKRSVTPEREERQRRARSIPTAFSQETLQRAFPSRDPEREESPSSSEDLSEQENSPLPEGLYEEEHIPPPDISHPDTLPDYDLPMSPPPAYVEIENKAQLATGYRPIFDPKHRPQRKQLYQESVVPKEEVELILVAPVDSRLQMHPRRLSYHEEAPIDEGPTREVYREASLGAVASLDPKPEHTLPVVLPDIYNDELPPGVEDKQHTLQPLSIETTRPDRDVESGRRRERKSETYECTSCGDWNPMFTSIGRFFLRRKESISDASAPRLLLIIGAIIGILGLIVFLGVFPNSFVYVEHYEIALLKNTFTGAVYRDTTYHPGCYVLGPEREFVKFPGSAIFVSLTEAVFTSDKLEITITFHFQYYLRPSELGELHRKFGLGYQNIIESVVKSRVKNSAIDLSLDDFRFNRTMVERKFFNVIQSRLQGTCCPDCCPSCSNTTVCNVCDTTAMCDPIYHVDIRYFQMATVVIANDVSERYLKSLLLKVTAEAEFFKQNHTVIEKQTEQMIEQRKNDANELIKAGEAEGAATMLVAEGRREANITTGYAVALWTMYNKLGITSMDHKLSLMMVRALEDVSVKGNLYRGYNYANQTMVNMGSG